MTEQAGDALGQAGGPGDRSPGLRLADLEIAVGLALLVGGIGFLLARVFWDNYDGLIMGQVASGIVHRHSVTVLQDPFRLNSPYSFYGIGMSLLMVPTIELARLVGASDPAGGMATNAWLLGALTGITYAWCRVRSCGFVASSAVALLVSLGCGLLPFASTGFAEVALAAAIAAGMLGLTATSLGRPWAPLIVGAAVGGAVVLRDDSLLLVAPWLVGATWLVAENRRNALVQMIAAGLPFAGLWMWYNAVRFGAPSSFGYDGIGVFNHSFLTGVYGYIASPARGLLFYVPVLLIALAGFQRAWRRNRVIATAAVGLLAGRILFFAPYWGWSNGGGFGPRYILPATPVLALGLMEVALAFRTIPGKLKAAALAVAAFGVAVGFVGGAVNYQRASLVEAMSREPALRTGAISGRALLTTLEAPATAAVVDRHMFSWEEFPITNESSLLLHRRDIATPALARPADRVRLAIAFAIMVAGLVGIGAGRRTATRPASPRFGPARMLSGSSR